MKTCCLLTMDDMTNYVSYETLLETVLAERGWQCQMISWRAKDVDWNSFDAVLVRTTWDYHLFPEDFLRVIEKISASNTLLANSADLIKWNINKKYLAELQNRGIAIVPTLFIGNNVGGENFATWQTKLESEELVLKPLISANSDNTFRLTSLTAAAETALAEREYMVQPFLQTIISEGEYSLFFFDGEYSHAIVKLPKPGDFRVQEEHGGIINSVKPDENLIATAANVLTKLDEMPLFARVDLIAGNDGEYQLMELELIEPSLYFGFDSNAAPLLAEKLEQRLR